MRKFVFASLFIGAILLAAATLTAQQKTPANKAGADETLDSKVQRLISQLGDVDWKRRDSATEELKSIGQPALSQLREALNHKDPEVQTRAQMLIAAIDPPPAPQPVARVANPPAVGGGGGGVIAVMPLMGGAQVAPGNALVIGGRINNVFAQINEAVANRNAQIEAILAEVDGAPAPAAQPVRPARPALQVPADVRLDLLNGFGAALGEAGDGLRVTDLKKNSTADKLGIAVGDILSKVNGRQVSKLQEAQEALGAIELGKPLQVEVVRGGNTISLQTQP